MIKNLFDVFTILFLFSLFGISHSVLASGKIKILTVKYFGSLMAFYRVAYVVVSLFLFYLVYSLSPRPDIIIYSLSYPFDIVIFVLRVISLAGIIWTLKYFRIQEFLGLSQVIRWVNKTYDPAESDERLTLMINGPYRFVRHPLYFFTIIFLAARQSVDLFYLTMLICITAYFYIGSFYEERKLIKKFGAEYLRYQSEVPRLLPLKILKPYEPKTVIS